MTKEVLTLTPTNTVAEAIELMRSTKIRHVPIVNNDATVVGIVTDRDLKGVIPSTLTTEQDNRIFSTELSVIMTKNPIVCHPMDFVEESAVIFYDNQIGSLPIVSNGKLVGIVTETDMLYNYIELTGAHQPGSQIEVRVPNVPGILYEVSKVFNEFQINVLSVLVYPDKVNIESKILVIRMKTMNPLNVIQGLEAEGFEVLWPNVPGIDL